MSRRSVEEDTVSSSTTSTEDSDADLEVYLVLQEGKKNDGSKADVTMIKSPMKKDLKKQRPESMELLPEAEELTDLLPKGKGSVFSHARPCIKEKTEEEEEESTY